MQRIKKNDTVKVISGKDKGKTGKVLLISPGGLRALIEGVNMAKKHMRQTRDNQKGGIIPIERPISISNIMPYCKNCAKPVKVGYSISKDKIKSRICRKCKQAI